MARRVQTFIAVAVVLGLSTGTLDAQSSARGGPAFDVAAIKPNASEWACLLHLNLPNRLTGQGCRVARLIQVAFQVRKDQVDGLPSWGQTAAFDINATFSPEVGRTLEDKYQMLQRLLFDRFMLAFHRERRPVTTYELLLARKDGAPGPGMRPSDINCDQWIAEKRNRADEGVPSSLTPDHRRPACMFRVGDDYIVGGTQTIAALAKALEGVLGRPVVDRTPWLRPFDIDVKFSRRLDTSVSGAATDPGDAPSIATALEEQLGLKLQRVTAPVDFIVVDHVERPTED